MQTDEELASRAAVDEDAFRALLEKYQNVVYNLSLKYCGIPEDALDLAQEIFVKMWKGLRSFRGDAQFSTWLYRLAHNACMDYARRRKKHRALSLDDENSIVGELPDNRYDPVKKQETRQLREDIERALGYLSPEFRSILLLREVSGLSYAEIAAVLSLEEGTVKSRLCRARLRVRGILQKMWNEPAE